MKIRDSTRLGAILLSALVWWSLPLTLFVYPSAESIYPLALQAIGFLVLAIVLCGLARTRIWAIIIWLPPSTLLLIATLWFARACIMNMDTSGFLGGLAFVILLPQLVVSLVGLCFVVWLRPKTYEKSLVIASLFNTTGIFLALVQCEYHANRQDIVVNIRDFSGRPIKGARLVYKRYAYGAWGSSDFVGDGNPQFSDANGIVRPHMRRLRNEIQGKVTHPDFLEVTFSIGMQSDDYDKDRMCWMGRSVNAMGVYGEIAVADPLSMYLYLPPRSREVQSTGANYVEATTFLTEGAEGSVWLDLGKGVFATTPSGDLRIELSSIGTENHQRSIVEVHSLSESGVFLRSPERSFSHAIEHPEVLFDIAPASGYSQVVTMESPGSRVFAFARGGALHASFELHVSTRSEDDAGTHICRLYMVRNENGRRGLERPLP